MARINDIDMVPANFARAPLGLSHELSHAARSKIFAAIDNGVPSLS